MGKNALGPMDGHPGAEHKESEGRGRSNLKIIVTIDVPDGPYCDGCDLWYRAENKHCYCLLFGMVELDRTYANEWGPGGEDIHKCEECRNAEEESYEADG